MEPSISAFGQHIEPRLLAGLSKIALVLRHHGWSDATGHGVTPTQSQILSLLMARRPQTLGVSAIADELAITKPTVSDSVAALVRKELVEKNRSSGDARAVELRITPKGEAIAAGSSIWPESLLAATRSLTPAEQAALLRGLVKFVRSLQNQGLIPVARMCVNCNFFQPDAHQAHQPYHCHFYQSPIGEMDLQVDCREHVTAPPDRLKQIWEVYR